MPYSGEGYLGLYTYWTYAIQREYKSVELTEPLVAGVGYHAKFHVSRMDSCWFATRNIGMLLSVAIPEASLSHLLSVEPQVSYDGNDFLIDKDGWMTVEGSFIANGGERYLTLGNFDDDANTDTLFVPGGGVPPAHSEVFWSSSYYYVDGVSLVPDSVLGLAEVDEVVAGELSPRPNPNNGTFSIDLPDLNGALTEMRLFDVSGKLVGSRRLYAGVNTLRFNTAPGLYLYGITVNGAPKWTGKVAISSD